MAFRDSDSEDMVEAPVGAQDAATVQPVARRALTESWRAEISAGLAAAIAVAAFLGPIPLGVVVVLLALAIAWGWPSLIRLPSPLTASVAIGIVGVGAVVVVWLTREAPLLRWIPLLLAFGVLLAFVRELVRADGRERLVESVTGTVTGMVVAACGAGWLAIDQAKPTFAIEVVGAITLAVGSALAGLPLRGWTAAGTIVVGAALAGLGGGLVITEISPLLGLLVGIMIGLVIASVRHLFAHLKTAGKGRALAASIALPASAAGLAVYIIGMLGSAISI